ncbi:hypothetical protein Poli38472_012882 [Pythium oligandrum]|uniref:Rhodanese domain-containing protein n=1 Tax=Pythium oligandrum TaxID=41045 RepID=A0A8K1FHT8_PYTOL|nr:hypothetical protein Poli38472_012882 [Pythium oligandrum]|eukprot:TMW64260.1 hypothetical protein Poli38472_012882 [Pythium oligandrum]
MTGMDGCASCRSLQSQLQTLQAENERLRAQLSNATAPVVRNQPEPEIVNETRGTETFSALSRREMQRYGRQMLVPDFRIARQLRLRDARVLVLGAGGLGCPVALYLASMGVGHLGLVDNDRVERSNLHRQIGHDETTIGQFKVHSLADRLERLNPDITIDRHVTRLTHMNAKELVEAYDVVVDGTDNPTTRYLVNDVCARLRKLLVSGSALGLEGQVTVFTYGDDEACYRCLYPQPPQNPQSCEENGVLGVTTGIIGCVLALEVVRVLTGLGKSMVGTQLLFDAYDSQFRRLKIATKRRNDCIGCQSDPSSPLTAIKDAGCDCEVESVVELDTKHQLDVHEFAKLRENAAKRSYTLLDTRSSHQFEMTHFPEAINVPFEALAGLKKKQTLAGFIRNKLQEAAEAHGESTSDNQLLVICRRGVDSVTVTQWLLEAGISSVYNIQGGYTRYAAIEPRFPMY